MLDVSLPTGYGVATYPPGATFGPRRMRDWELVWLMQGDAEYRWGDSQIAAPEGSVVLCRPGATDFFQWDLHRRTRHAFVHFQVHRVPDDWPDWTAWPFVRAPEEDDILRPLFRHLLTWADGGDAAQCRLILMTMLTAFQTGQRATGNPAREVWPPAVEQVCAFIAERLDEDPATALPLPALAEVACVTPEHLCRLFKAALGHSPAETVRLARLDRAAILLARSNYTVGEVAALYGFLSPFHFSRAFKKVQGQSPSAFRRQTVAGGQPPLSPLARTVPP
ncbi:MAG: helix-turn-helix transcriptional regulator [Armatimonadota bacterium]|nr:helix-turn-helix transcriptional regulator [Armatimonadota bacterium]